MGIRGETIGQDSGCFPKAVHTGESILFVKSSIQSYCFLHCSALKSWFEIILHFSLIVFCNSLDWWSTRWICRISVVWVKGYSWVAVKLKKLEWKIVGSREWKKRTESFPSLVWGRTRESWRANPRKRCVAACTGNWALRNSDVLVWMKQLSEFSLGLRKLRVGVEIVNFSWIADFSADKIRLLDCVTEAKKARVKYYSWEKLPRK